MPRKLSGKLILVFVLLLTNVPRLLLAQPANDWQGFRGNDGRANIAVDSGLKSGKFDLRVRWKRPVGSGYSGITISDGRCVTMAAGKDKDSLICFSSSSGDKLWETAVDENYAGQSGSFDGPVSTPTIAGDSVVALSAQGKLLAAKLDNGKIVWTRQLTEPPIAATKPMYGFSCSPIVVNDTVVAVCGGKDSFVCGFDLETGKTRWSSENDNVQCQSPVLMKIAGRQMIVAAGMTKLFGLDPATGEKLFAYEHGGTGARGAFSIVPVQIDSERIFIAHDDRSSSIVRVEFKDKEFSATQTSTTRAIQNTFNVPVFHDGKLFGYNNRILTALDVETNRQLWKSRNPGDAFHIIVDGHLVLITKKGDLSIASTGTKKFKEIRAVKKLFEDLVWSLPSFSNNAIYVRSLGEIARVDIVPAAKPGEAAVATEALPLSDNFTKFISKLNREPDEKSRKKIINQFVDNHPVTPVIEQGIAHFYYYDDAGDVAIASNIFGARQERKMIRIDDFFYYAVRLPADQRAEYSLFVDFQSTNDPRNKNTSFESSIYVDDMEVKISYESGDLTPINMSWFAMPNWKPPRYLKAIDTNSPKPISGSMQTIKVQELNVDVYLPPGYADSELRYPVVYIHGSEARTIGKIEFAFDALIQSKTVKPAILVFMPLETGDPTPENFPTFVSQKLIPAVDNQLRTKSDRKHRTNYSAGFLAPMGMLTAARNSELFSATAVQSPFIFGGPAEGAFTELKNVDNALTVYSEWGSFDMFNPHENWDMRKIGKRVFDESQASKNLTVVGGKVSDTTGWHSWRNRFEEVFKTLLK